MASYKPRRSMIRYLFSFVFLFAMAAIIETNAQTNRLDTLLYEDFNKCELSTDWKVVIEGNQDAVWYVGYPQNPGSDGSTIDGTCMLIIDDDATGNNTDPFLWRIYSPIFDTKGYTTIVFTADVHMRNAGETFRVLLKSDSEEYELRKLEGRNFNGTQFSQFLKVSFDLSFYPLGEYQLVFEYNDNNKWAWWAGVDNIKITGEGRGDILLTQTFDDCLLPTDWYTYAESGDHVWEVGIVPNPKAGSNNSMNGSCFLYFDDDGIGQEARPSKVVVVSEVFDATVYASYTLSFDLIYRTYTANEYLEIGILNEKGFLPVETITTAVGGTGFNNFRNITLDLSAFKSRENRIYFRYDDGSNWNWWLGIDNVKMVGEGNVNDFCYKALDVQIGEDWHTFDTRRAFAPDDIPYSCNQKPESALWFRFFSDDSQLLTYQSQSRFNDAIEIFKGEDCQSLQLLDCKDRDEYGFYGEELTLQVERGPYYMRITTAASEFGEYQGLGAFQLSRATGTKSKPTNENCTNAQLLKIEDDCLLQNNYLSEKPQIFPSTNHRSRSDVWYTFTGIDEEPMIFKSNAGFSEVICLYSGSCENLQEVKSEFNGGQLLMSGLQDGETYYVQVSGYFSTLEGPLCSELKLVEDKTTNDDCFAAIEIKSIDFDEGGINECKYSSNITASFSGVQPSCDPLADADIWFSYTPSKSGKHYIKANADFITTIAVYKDECDFLTPVFCNRDALACEEYLETPSLSSGLGYFIQIASRGRVAGFNRGNVCLEVLNEDQYKGYEEISLKVDQECVSKNAVKISVTGSGGDGNYSVFGIDENWLYSGEQFTVQINDGKGCVSQYFGVAENCEDAPCTHTISVITENALCYNDPGGFIVVDVQGGFAPYEFEWSDGGSGQMRSQLTAGEYELFFRDRGGCMDTLIMIITEPSPLTYELLSIIDTLSGFGEINIQISGGIAPYTVHWTKDGVDYPGDTNLTGLAAGVYEAVIIDYHGCIVKTEEFEIKTVTSTDKLYWEDTRIYPNPANNMLTIELSPQISGAFSWNLLSAEGKNNKSGEYTVVNGGKVHLLLHDISAGSYFLELNYLGQKSYFKLIKL